MKIKARFEHGSVLIGAQEYYVNESTLDVPEHIGKFLLSRGEYTIKLKKESSLQNSKNLLFIRGSGLGDVMMCTAVVRYIKEKINKNVNIDWLCGSGEYSEVLEGNKYIRKVYDIKTIPNDIDTMYDYMASIDMAEFIGNNSHYHHRIDLFARMLPELASITIEDKHLDYFIKEKEIDWLKSLKLRTPYITLTYKTSAANRMLSNEMNVQICKKILDAGIGVALADKDVIQFDKRAMTLSGMTIRQKVAIIYGAAAVLTPDTGIFHVASALDKPIVTYFGAINPRLRISSNNVHVLLNSVPCFPCDVYTCHLGQPLCVQGLKVDDIVNMVVKLVRAGQKDGSTTV